MKKLLLFALFFWPVMLFAQEADEPFKNSDLIIVESDLKPADALKQVALLMQERGFIIQRYSPELQSLVANKTSADPGGILFRIQVFIKETRGTKLQFSGDYQSGSDDGVYFRAIQYQTGIFQGIHNAIFNEMDKLAKAVSGSKLVYSKL